MAICCSHGYYIQGTQYDITLHNYNTFKHTRYVNNSGKRYILGFEIIKLYQHYYTEK